MCSRWQIRGIATLAALSLAGGSALALGQAPGAQAPGAQGPGAEAPGAQAPGSQAPGTDTGTTATTASGGSSQLSKSDETFIRKAAEGGLAEVQLGQLAQQQGSSEAVKRFGERMVTDHSAANDKLMSVAQSLNVQVPTTLSKKDQRELDKLQSLHGAAFDKAYARAMRTDHRTDIREFEHEAKHGTDPQVKQFADTTLPTLKEHLALAEKLPSSSRTASASGTETPATR